MTETATELVRFSPSDAAIALLKDQYMGLTIAGIDDKEGFERVHEARMVVKGHRVDVEKRRKLLKADALEYGRRVDSEAKRLTAMLQPIEDHLQYEEDIVTREKERIAAEEAARVAAITKARMEKLAAVGASVFLTEVQMWTDEDFDAELKTYTDAFNAKKAAEEAERKARAAEAEQNRIEAARLAEERRKMEEAQAELDRQRAEIDAEKRKLTEEAAARQRTIDESKRKEEEEEATKQRAAALEQARKEAAEKARIETEARIKREAAEKTERERIAAEKAEQKRLKREAARPDQEKLRAFAGIVRAMLIPVLSKPANCKYDRIKEILGNAAAEIEAIAAGLEE